VKLVALLFSLLALPVLAQGYSQRPPSESTVPVLIYHQVTDSKPPGDTVISPTRLREHLDVLKQEGYSTITIAALQALIVNHRPIPPRTVVLTFDDGWKEHLEVAQDLEKRSLTATFYVLTGFFSDPRYLSIGELQLLARIPGMEIGSHSHSHFMDAAGNLVPPSPNDAISEALLSKFTLQDLTRREVVSFAWPFGHSLPALLPAFAKLGYTSVAGVHSLTLNGRGTNVFDLQRLNVSGLCTAADLREMVLLSTYKSCK